jgi:hypothetical protein
LVEPPENAFVKKLKYRDKMSWRRTNVFVGSVTVLFSTVLFCGCVSKSKADARAQAAYLAGQNAALQQQQQQTRVPGVKVIGPVQNPDVPWVDGLTLAQAIATANYLGQHDPKEIIITRQGESAKLAPKWLLNGADVPLEPGDTITIHE